MRERELSSAPKRRIAPTVWILAIWTFLFVALPLLYVIGITFLEKDDVWGITNVFTLENYKNLVSAVYGKVFLDRIAAWKKQHPSD